MKILQIFLCLFIFGQIVAAQKSRKQYTVKSKKDSRNYYISLTTVTGKEKILSISKRDFDFEATKTLQNTLFLSGILNKQMIQIYQPDVLHGFLPTHSPAASSTCTLPTNVSEINIKQVLLDKRKKQIHDFWDDAQFEPFTSNVRDAQKLITDFFSIQPQSK